MSKIMGAALALVLVGMISCLTYTIWWIVLGLMKEMVA